MMMIFETAIQLLRWWNVELCGRGCALERVRIIECHGSHEVRRVKSGAMYRTKNAMAIALCCKQQELRTIGKQLMVFSDNSGLTERLGTRHLLSRKTPHPKHPTSLLYHNVAESQLSIDMVQRICFVTIGATASFDQLIKATLSPGFLQALQASDYTTLSLQYGKNGQQILQEFRENVASGRQRDYGMDITGFDFNKQGLGQEMKTVKAGKNRQEGVVISHAGKMHDHHCVSIETDDPRRLRLHSRCSSHLSPSYRRPKSFIIGQSPGGTGRGTGQARLCCLRTSRVSKVTVLNRELELMSNQGPPSSSPRGRKTPRQQKCVAAEQS